MQNLEPSPGTDAQPPLRSTKGERTRQRLLAATRKILSAKGYSATRIEDIAAAAKVAKGTFYLYFENKEAVTMAVLAEVMAEGERMLRGARTVDDPFLEILEPTVAYARLVFSNAGLFRAFVQFSHAHPEAAKLWSEITRKWLAGVEAVMDRRLGKGQTDPVTRRLVVYAMSWMVDGVLLSFLSRDYPGLQNVLESPEQLGETLSVLWYRAVYGEDPSPEQLTSGKAVLDFHLAQDHNE